MTSLTIDNKKYVLIPRKKLSGATKKAALKQKAEKTFSIEEARAYSKNMIRKWASEK